MQKEKWKMQNWQRAVRSDVDGGIELYQTCRGDHRSSEVVSDTVAHPSVAQKHDLQKPSLVREGAEERGG